MRGSLARLPLLEPGRRPGAGYPGRPQAGPGPGGQNRPLAASGGFNQRRGPGRPAVEAEEPEPVIPLEKHLAHFWELSTPAGWILGLDSPAGDRDAPAQAPERAEFCPYPQAGMSAAGGAYQVIQEKALGSGISRSRHGMKLHL
jgi:hypothetical protein